MTKHIATSIAMFASAIMVLADEPGWNDQERLEKRDMVCIGQVDSVTQAESSDTNNVIFLAVVEISEIKKGEKGLLKSKINIYYESSLSGQKRCPAYAKLKKGDKGTFYLSTITDELKKARKLEKPIEPAFFLEMGSDVKKQAAEQSTATTTS